MTIEVSQRVPAAPEVVFGYFTDADKYRSWKGLEAELDPRPGGVYRVKMWSGGSIEGEYLIVEPPHRVVFSWGWRGNELPPSFAVVSPGSSTVEVTFTPDGDGTIVRLRHSGLPDDDARSAHSWGWSNYLPRLDAVLRGQDPGEEPAPGRARAYNEGLAR